MTTYTRKFIVTLFIIAILASMLSACSPAQLIAAAQGDTGSAASYGKNVNASPRISTCDFSSKQNLLNEANGQSDDEAQSTTVDAFLDARMPKYTCIAAKK